MGLIIQQRALEAARGLRQVMPGLKKRDRSLFEQIHRAMNSVVPNIAEAVPVLISAAVSASDARRGTGERDVGWSRRRE